VRDVLWEAFATLAIAAAIIAIVLALAVAAIAVLAILPLALLVVRARRTRAVRREPIVLIEAREIVARAWTRIDWPDLTIAPEDGQRRKSAASGQIVDS
jgi:hypothetical protein